MSQFDESTNRKAQEWERVSLADGNDCADAYTEGRNSAKESVEILATAMLKVYALNGGFKDRLISEAIAAVKAHGNWPLDKPAESRGGKGE